MTPSNERALPTKNRRAERIHSKTTHKRFDKGEQQ
jgi:hypothetical protein